MNQKFSAKLREQVFFNLWKIICINNATLVVWLFRSMMIKKSGHPYEYSVETPMRVERMLTVTERKGYCLVCEWSHAE